MVNRPTEDAAFRRMFLAHNLIAACNDQIDMTIPDYKFWALNRRYGANTAKYGIGAKEYETGIKLLSFKLEFLEIKKDPSYG